MAACALARSQPSPKSPSTQPFGKNQRLKPRRPPLLPVPGFANHAHLGRESIERPRCWYLRSTAHHCLRRAAATVSRLMVTTVITPFSRTWLCDRPSLHAGHSVGRLWRGGGNPEREGQRRRVALADSSFAANRLASGEHGGRQRNRDRGIAARTAPCAVPSISRLANGRLSTGRSPPWRQCWISMGTVIASRRASCSARWRRFPGEPDRPEGLTGTDIYGETAALQGKRH